MRYYIVDLAKYPLVEKQCFDKEVSIIYLFDLFKKESVLKASPIILNEYDFKKLKNIDNYIRIDSDKEIYEIYKKMIEKLFFIANKEKTIFRFYDPCVSMILISILNNSQKNIFFKDIDIFTVKYNGKVVSYSIKNKIHVDYDAILLNDEQIFNMEKERVNFIKIDFYKKQKEFFGANYNEISKLLDFFFLINIYNFYEIERVFELIGNKIINLDTLETNPIFNFMYDEKISESMRVNQIYMILGMEY